MQRDFAQGRPLPDEDQTPTTAPEGDPVIAVLLSPADTSADWMETGRALLRLSLAAEEAGLALGYVNQPTEVAGLREELAGLRVDFARTLRASVDQLLRGVTADRED